MRFIPCCQREATGRTALVAVQTSKKPTRTHGTATTKQMFAEQVTAHGRRIESELLARMASLKGVRGRSQKPKKGGARKSKEHRAQRFTLSA